jgi:hypothetical protein
MIVGDFFDGDWDHRLKWEQHDVYNDALRIIVRGCRDHAELAIALLQAQWPEGWESTRSVDHRTLQGAHDILAAVWRSESSPAQSTLRFDLAPPEAGDNMIRWLAWLRSEIEAWRQAPYLIRQVFAILANQNQPAGYQAEAALAGALHKRFSEIPWSKPPVGPTSAEPDDDDRFQCECTELGRPACGAIPCVATCERAAKDGWGPLE